MKGHTISSSKTKQTIRIMFRKRWTVKISFALIMLFLLAAALAPIITPYTPIEQDLTNTLKPPSSEHLLGTDNFGRDVLTRILYGARISLVNCLLSSLIAAAIGSTFGLIAGYFGGFVRGLIMRITDAQLCIPPIILTMVLASLFQGVVGVSLVIGIGIMPSYIRMIYSMVLSLRENDYIVASSVIGQSKPKILFKHLLPNCFAPLIVMFTMNLGVAILLESSLSYLGVGITAPTPAWGSMVADGFRFLISNPMLALLPGFCVLIIVVSFNLLGDGLRDALDPRLRGKL